MGIQAHSFSGPFPDSLWDQSWTRTWQINRIVLLVKEAKTLYVYWEVSDLRKSLIAQHFCLDWVHLPFFLQVYDVTDIMFNGHNANSSRKMQVHPLSDNWYVHDVLPRRRYLVDFGTTTLEGHFFTILRSNIVESPPLPSDSRFEPSVRFGKVQRQLTPIQVSNTVEKAPSDRPVWEEHFDGYTLVEKKRGKE